MIKKTLAVLAVLVLAGTVLATAGCGGNLPKGAVAKVGSVVVTQETFDERIADFEKQYAGQIPDKATDAAGYKEFQQYVLEYMITFELVSQEAEAKKLTVSDADVQAEIDKVITGTFAGDQTQFDAALTEQGITLEDLKKYYQENLLFQKVYDDVTKSVAAVTDAEAQSYYDQNKTDYYTPESRTARHILLTPAAGRVDATTTTTTSSTTSTTAGATTPTAESTTTTAAPTQADWDSALVAAKLVRQQLVAGADWTIEAKVYSDDPGSKDAGGDLGSFGQGDMVEEFDAAVFSMKVDEISEPIKTTFGYHVIQVTGITPAVQQTFDEVKDSINEQLLAEKKEKAWQDWLTAQKTKATVTYASGWETTTTTSEATSTTVAPAGDTATTVAPAGETTTTAGATITTAGSTATTAATTATTAAATSTTAAQ